MFLSVTYHLLPRFRGLAALLLATIALPSSGLLTATSAKADGLTTLHSFNGPPDGITPAAGLVLGTDGNFYGTVSNGGLGGSGTVFSLTPAGVLTTLHNFTGSVDGGAPNAGLVAGNDGNFYGTTSSGGQNFSGTVFRITPLGALTTLYSFNGSDGSDPEAALTLGRDGNFYGNTRRGGDFNSGTVFTITPAGTLTTLHSFTFDDDGNLPSAALLQGPDGNFYGTTQQGAANNYGTVFSITPAGVLTVLHTFDYTADGAFSNAALVLGPDGNFYGATVAGGANTYGTIFRITAAGAFTNLHDFYYATEGAAPAAALVLGPDGNFYGTATMYGPGAPDSGLGKGTVFRVTPEGVLTTLYGFTGGDGSFPASALVLGANGMFYGTTTSNGPGGFGTVFSVTPAGVQTTVFAFRRSTDGVIPTAGLVLAGDGNFYGTTQYGGLLDYGTVFRVTPAGVTTPLHSFDNVTDGSYPSATMVLGNDGNLYGTTASSGGDGGGGGTIFRLTPAGELTTLHEFTGLSEGFFPVGPLTKGSDGNFYGTTLAGDLDTYGTIFQITPSGMLTTLYTFVDPVYYGLAGLVQGRDGNFYGLTGSGPNHYGAIFRFSPASSTPELVYSFTGGADGGSPNTALTLGRDGNLYGTTTSYGPGNQGTVFRFSPTSGVLTPLYGFTGGSDGGVPLSPLTQGRDGNFYGTTIIGGSAGVGTLFRVTLAGAFKVLHTFTGGVDGAAPSNAALALGRDGNFYGTASGGGANGRGVVFRLRVLQSSTLNPAPRAEVNDKETKIQKD